MKKIPAICSILIILYLLFGCKGPSANKETMQQKSPIEEFKDQAAEIMPNVADLTDIAWLFELSAAEYIPELVHNPQEWESYKGKPEFAAANFGVFTADAIYQYAFDQMDGAYMSWAAAKSLSEELGFIDIFDKVIIKRIEGDFTQKDSIFNQIDEAFTKLGATYSDDEKLRIYTTLLTGNYIEKVHLVMGTLFDTELEIPDETRLLMNRELLLILIRQLESLEQLVGLIEEHETIEDTGFLSLELKKMRDIFHGFDVSADNLANLTYEQIFNNERINELHDHLLKIRSFLIQGGTDS